MILWDVPDEHLYIPLRDWTCPGCKSSTPMYWWKDEYRPRDATVADFFVQDFCSPECAVAYALRSGSR